MLEIKLYQVNTDRDEQRVAFEPLSRLARYQGTAVPKSELYDRVFTGKVDTNYLDGVFHIFNVDYPIGYTGRSMSVSDVLEVVSSDNKDVKPGFYFCDSIGFKEVPFEPEKTTVFRRPDLMTVLYLAPGEKARVLEISPSLRSMQRLVRGQIEPVSSPFAEKVCIVCNEEGKINGMERNRAIYVDTLGSDRPQDDPLNIVWRFKNMGITLEQVSEELNYRDRNGIESGREGWDDDLIDYSTGELERVEGLWEVLREDQREMVEVIFGPCFICATKQEDFTSLSESQVKRYMKMFELPEQFNIVNGKLIAIPYDPDKKIDSIISNAQQKTQDVKSDKTPEQER